MKTTIISALLLISTITCAQNDAQPETKKTLNDFNEIMVDGGVTVQLKKSDAPYYSCAENSTVVVEQKDGKLYIRQEGKKANQDEKITLGYTSLKSIYTTGAAYVKSGEPFKADEVAFSVMGASKCKLEVNVQTITAEVGGAATLQLTGTCQTLKAGATGASSLKADNLQTENATVNTSGAATAKINVSNKLMGNVSGASTLKYAGEPKETQISQTGASSVKRIDKDGNSSSSDTAEKNAGNNGKDSTHTYSINSRYDIVIHDRSKNDTTWWPGHKSKFKSIRKQNWAGVDLFENGFLTPDNNITLPYNQDYMSLNYGGRNLGWNLNAFEKDFRFAGGHLQVVTGLGFSFNYYNLKNKTTLNADSSYTGTYAYNTSADYRKNRLRESWVTVPLMLELNTSHKRSRNFHIAAGVIGGLKLGSSTKQIFTMNNHSFETIRHDDYNLFPFKLDATVRVGYGHFTLFATYSLTPLFEYGKGPEVYPFTVGLRIIPFD